MCYFPSTKVAAYNLLKSERANKLYGFQFFIFETRALITLIYSISSNCSFGIFMTISYYLGILWLLPPWLMLVLMLLQLLILLPQLPKWSFSQSEQNTLCRKHSEVKNCTWATYQQFIISLSQLLHKSETIFEAGKCKPFRPDENQNSSPAPNPLESSHCPTAVRSNKGHRTSFFGQALIRRFSWSLSIYHILIRRTANNIKVLYQEHSC